jgi:hypothetical protein
VAIDKDYLVTDKVASLPTIPTRDNGRQHFIDYLHRTLPRHLATGPLLMTTRLDAGDPCCEFWIGFGFGFGFMLLLVFAIF